MNYTVTKQDNQIFLIEKNAEHTPICLDTAWEDQPKLEKMIGQEINDLEFIVIETPIPGKEEFYNTIAKLR